MGMNSLPKTLTRQHCSWVQHTSHSATESPINLRIQDKALNDETLRCRVAEYLDVHEKSSSDYDDRPPALMTKEVLAKFRMMEAEQQASKLQTTPLRRQVCAKTTCWHFLFPDCIFTAAQVVSSMPFLGHFCERFHNVGSWLSLLCSVRYWEALSNAAIHWSVCSMPLAQNDSFSDCDYCRKLIGNAMLIADRLAVIPADQPHDHLKLLKWAQHIVTPSSGR